MNAIAKQLVSALNAATNVPPKDTNKLLYEFQIVPAAPRDAISKDELRGLSAEQRKWAKNFAGMTTYSEYNAKVRYSAQFANGADHTDEKVRTRGLESYISEGAAKTAACRSTMGEASMAAAKLVNTINARLLPIAERILAERQKSEKAEAEKYGLALVPSALSTAMAGFVNVLRVTHIGDSGHKPSDFCPFITLD